MKVFKFGGASVKNADAIRNVAGIIRSHAHENLFVVVSAMGTTTNALEQIVFLARVGKNFDREIEKLHDDHVRVAEALFQQPHEAVEELDRLFIQIRTEAVQPGDDDQAYDQVVSLGEVAASQLLSRYLNTHIPTLWIDARRYIATDATFREGKINWEQTRKNLRQLPPRLNEQVVVSQGFIGSTHGGATTTLGREGSDFSAAIFASCLQAESVTIWKDVAGVMNADPKRLPDARVFDFLPFREAAEMTYYGASIIHPKTIKPLANAGIPLHVKSFSYPHREGTTIHEGKVDHLPPLIIFKENQCLISCKVTDYSFITEYQIGVIFQTLSERNIKINVMQSSAISFSFCVDFIQNKILKLIDVLGKDFEVFYNTGLTLITVKNYDQKLFQEFRNMAGVLLEQSSRSTLQILVKE